VSHEPPSSLGALAQARDRYAKKAWADAREALLLAEQTAPLALDDLWLLATSAGLSGRDSLQLATYERIYQACAETDEALQAARAAFWLGFRLFAMGEASRASGWHARAERVIERAGPECVEQGYLLIGVVRRNFMAGNYPAAHEAASAAEQIAQRFGDADLCVFARSLQGRVLIRQGELVAGLKLLDEVMLAVTAGELSPVLTGLIYCSSVDTCQSIYAVDRAREWTTALGRWCDAQPQLVTFTGACMTSRAEIMQTSGLWREALAEVDQAEGRHLESIEPRGVAEAHYRRAEIQRLRGDSSAAEESYRQASQGGRDPLPGFALLRLAQGQVELAANAIRRAAGDASDPFKRAKLWPALIEILLAAGATEEARTASGELDEVAQRFGSDLLRALAGHARGSVQLAEGDARAAAATLGIAFRGLQDVGAPYLAAKARVTLACACQALGDEDGAMLEGAAARAVFAELGAAADIAALDALAATVAPSPTASNAGGLTARELEVLRLVAGGKTNKLIGRELCLAEKTVDRHLSNILAKLDVPSRAAATAYAYQHKLL
jgi:DNA-binding CsgD family transcriptional regulator